MVMTHILDIGQAQIKKDKAVCREPLGLCFGVSGGRTPSLLLVSPSLCWVLFVVKMKVINLIGSICENITCIERAK